MCIHINTFLFAAHPNLKLFITHGGLLSTTEAVHRGVPVLGIPIFGDQPLNMKHTENAGLGRTFDLDDLTADSFYTAIMEVATNPRYVQQTTSHQQKLERIKLENQEYDDIRRGPNMSSSPRSPSYSGITKPINKKAEENWYVIHVSNSSGSIIVFGTVASTVTLRNFHLFFSYATAAKVRSSVFRDTETAPIIKAVWWVEYVIRHKGAPHLQSAAQHLSWYQLHQLDVIAYLSAIVLVLSWVLIKSTKAILSKMCSYFCKETKTVKKSKKNN